MIFVSLLSMKNFFLGEFIHSILHRKGGGKKMHNLQIRF